MRSKNYQQGNFNEKGDQQSAQIYGVENINQDNVCDDGEKKTASQQVRPAEHQEDAAEKLYEGDEVPVEFRVPEVVPGQPEPAYLPHRFVEFRIKNCEL